MEGKKSKYIKLHYSETVQSGKKKRQYKITLPAKLVDRLRWQPKENLKIWVTKRRSLELRKRLKKNSR